MRCGGMSHRARGLMLIGIVWILIGTRTLVEGASIPADAYPLALLSDEIVAVLWLVTGSVAVSSALGASGADSSKWAFVGLLVPATLRMVSYAWSAAVSVVTDLGQPSAWLHALSWAVVIGFVLHEAATPEIPPRLAEHGRTLP